MLSLSADLVKTLDSFVLTDVVSKSVWERRISYANYQYCYELRLRHIQECGFPILTEEVVSVLLSILVNKNVVDVGCGTGYLASVLQKNGIAVSAVDDRSTRYSKDSLKARHFVATETDARYLDLSNYDVVIMSWPDYGSDFASVICDNMQVGQLLLYQGEHSSGCCGNDDFFECLSRNFREYDRIYGRLNLGHCTFSGLHDRWHLYRKTVKLNGT